MAPLAPPASSQRNKPTKVVDPDEYRMTFGEHLEELRTRLILGLGGFFVAFVICLTVVRDYVFQILTMPLLDVMHQYELTPMLYDNGTGGAFSVYLKLSAIAAVVIAGPWLLYQIWMFVAAGLYPHERKTVTRFIPLSIALLIGGVLFAFYIVLPMTLSFFIWFTTTIKVPSSYEPVATTMPAEMPQAPMLQGDPVSPPNGAFWFNLGQSRLKINVNGHTRILQFTSENLVSPFITLSDYTDMLLMMLLVFGLSFQTPLAVILLVGIGIFELEEMRAMRKIVYFVIVIIAAVITPGDVVTATIALMVPLCGLFELGLLLARPQKSVESPTSPG
jgi:sec-independent protein translocase protein TatC